MEHTVAEMLAQRIYGPALGYKDLCDHEQLRSDPVFALLSGKRKLEEPLAGDAAVGPPTSLPSFPPPPRNLRTESSRAIIAHMLNRTPAKSGSDPKTDDHPKHPSLIATKTCPLSQNSTRGRNLGLIQFGYLRLDLHQCGFQR